MMATQRVLQHLADGRFHSGAQLGAALGVSRSAVWKQIQRLAELGLDVHAVRGRGYRLAEPLELLDAEIIRQALPPESQTLLRRLEVQFDLDSTNRYLRQAGAPAGHVCLAERQTGGRGRRGRKWVSPFGSNIYLSAAWRFGGSAAALSGLSLALGVATARALERAGVAGVGLKWPNDLLWQQRKLGGLLLELFGEACGPCDVVVGVGLNVAMPAADAALVDQPWTDLRSILGDTCPGRNRMASLLLAELLPALARYEQDGLTPFLDDWRRLDVAAGREVRLQLARESVTGTAVGVDASGALLVRSGATTRRFASGEISMRLAT